MQNKTQQWTKIKLVMYFFISGFETMSLKFKKYNLLFFGNPVFGYVILKFFLFFVLSFFFVSLRLVLLVVVLSTWVISKFLELFVKLKPTYARSIFFIVITNLQLYLPVTLLSKNYWKFDSLAFFLVFTSYVIFFIFFLQTL